MQIRTILSTVARVRKQFEHQKISPNLLAQLYKTYNPKITHVDLFVTRAMAQFPQLNCGLASLFLQKTLRRGKVIQGAYDGIPHTFLLLDTAIVDITADQYGGPAVYIGALQWPWSLTK